MIKGNHMLEECDATQQFEDIEVTFGTSPNFILNVGAKDTVMSKCNHHHQRGFAHRGPDRREDQGSMTEMRAWECIDHKCLSEDNHGDHKFLREGKEVNTVLKDGIVVKICIASTITHRRETIRAQGTHISERYTASAVITTRAREKRVLFHEMQFAYTGSRGTNSSLPLQDRDEGAVWSQHPRGSSRRPDIIGNLWLVTAIGLVPLSAGHHTLESALEKDSKYIHCKVIATDAAKEPVE